MAGSDEALAALRFDWGEAYKTGRDEERGYWALRRDGLGEDLTAHDPDKLRALIRTDYNLRPVPRDAGAAAGEQP